MWEKGWRQNTWNELDQEWDLLIIGGGITGAGIFRRAVEEGYRTLLVERSDFSSGTSSTSSKLIHGGIRYLRNKQFRLSQESVREREWLLKEAKNLVTPLGFLMPYPRDPKIHAQFGVGVIIYDLLAPKWNHTHFSKSKLLQICPALESGWIRGGYFYYDAGMDDCRVVLRILREGVMAGGVALNYTSAAALLRSSEGKVCGAVLRDLSPQMLGEKEIKAKVVINATGPWSDEVRNQIGAPAKLRKLRGSHLVFPRARLNLPSAISLVNPQDRRAMFAIPWEGVTLIGTTDLDHTDSITRHTPFTTQQEIEYILEFADSTFPTIGLERKDILSTFSGVRPVINTGAANPSKESRAHAVWEEEGLITVTGGKFTTFRIMAEQTLQKALPRLPFPADLSKRKRYFNRLPEIQSDALLPTDQYEYLLGRYGTEVTALLECALPGENETILTTPNCWSELRWAARTGAVEHLDDLLLRRVRIGLLLPNAATSEMARIRAIVQPEMGWSDARWDQEQQDYLSIYENTFSPSPKGSLDKERTQ